MWTDENLTPGTQHWARAIDENLENCDAVVVLLSPAAYASEWVDSECSKARIYGKGIFPLHIEGDPEDAVPLSLWSIQRIDIRKDFEGGMEELLEALRIRGFVGKVKSPREPPPITPETEERFPKRNIWLLAVIIPVVLLAAWGIYKIVDGNEPSDPVVVKTTPNVTPVDIDITPIALVTDTPAFSQTTIATSVSSLGLGSTMTSERDGMKMVYVPEGVFPMGSDGGMDDEKPEHEVFLDAFWIDKYEVTNAQYAKCTATGRCEVPEDTEYFYQSSYAEHPVIYVSWLQAQNYCEWAGRRLPTEAEWEKAARGPYGRTYPWGETEPNPNMLNYDLNINTTTEVGGYPDGASLYGAMDMAGNVWEWVADWYDAGFYSISRSENPTGPASGEYRVMRGASWVEYDGMIRSALRRKSRPGITYFDSGFRCAISAEDVE